MSRKAGLFAGLALAALCAIGLWPATTHVGYDYAWSQQRLPRYEKLLHFISRDLQLRRLAQAITRGASTREERLERLFTWVTRHIVATPPGLPVIDDHVLYTIVRGYGAEDQRTEVFVTLVGYAGWQGSVARLQAPAPASGFIFVALISDGLRHYVFDIARGVVFRDARGQLAQVSHLLAQPELIAAAAPGRVVDGTPYADFLLNLPRAKTFSRTTAQQFWPRVRAQLSR